MSRGAPSPQHSWNVARPVRRACRRPCAAPLICATLVAALLAQTASAQDAAVEPLSQGDFEAALPSLDAPAAEAALPPSPSLDPSVESELAAPLAPLDVFQDAPPPQLTLPSQSQAPSEAPYTVRVDGLGSVGLDDAFEDVSALMADGDRAAPASQIRLRAEADAELARRLLLAEGYYDATVEVGFEPPTGRTDRLDVTLTASPGERYRIGDIRVAASDDLAARIAREAMTVRSGDPLVAAAIEASEANVALRLPENGYPFAEIGLRDVVLDDTEHRAEYTLPIIPGPRGRFGAVEAPQPAVFDAEHIARLARFEPGAPYDSRWTEDLRQALVATGLLSTVAVEPVRTGRVLGDGVEAVDLRVRQVAAPPRSVTASAGYATGEGFRLSGAWTHRNFFPPEGALGASAVLGSQEQRIGLTFRRSNAGARDRTLQVVAALSREDRDAYDARSFNLSARVSRDSTPLWQKRWTYAYGAELVATDESLFDTGSAVRSRETFLVAAAPAQVGYDTSDDLLDPQRGYRATLRLSPEIGRRSDVSAYLRTLLDLSAYAPVADRFVIAARARLGAVAGIERDELAPSRRQYAGGGGSVRGFGYQRLGPLDPQGRPAGGRSVVEFSLEARYRWKDFGIVPFIDAGQAYAGPRPGFDDLRVGVGVGARYFTPFGPFRIDIATPLARRKDEPRVALYISIGQAF